MKFKLTGVVRDWCLALVVYAAVTVTFHEHFKEAALDDNRKYSDSASNGNRFSRPFRASAM